MTGVVEVVMWGTTIGYLGYAPGQAEIATFEYSDDFGRSGVAVSPIRMPYPPALHAFSDLDTSTFKGLPGVFADSLPDSYGNRLIDAYMAERNVPQSDITALDRLLYVGNRGMGALEYQPAREFASGVDTGVALDLGALSELAHLVTSRERRKREQLLQAENRETALRLIRVGSSIGGARSKALVARAPGGAFFDGTAEHDGSYSFWIIKFDSDTSEEHNTVDPKGMPRVEFVYSLIARECGIDIPDTDYLVDGPDFHFLIRRFDRVDDNGQTRKLHYASWAGLAHADRDPIGTQTYEQLVLTARELGLGQDAVTELFRRAVFNVVGRNHDDHTKNFGFLMDKRGRWELAPAFDMTYSFDPMGKNTRSHQTGLSRKRNGFEREDLLRFGDYCNLGRKKSREIVEAITDAFARFPSLATEYDVPLNLRETIAGNLRLHL
jgi:serine/threonine-protein kinase HipA